MSARELVCAYRERALSPVEVVEACLARIEELDAQLGAFTTPCPERARDEAAACERAYRRGGEPRALTGVPFAVKDLFDSAGVRTTYGSPMFSDHVPEADATAVARARAAGAVMLGKTRTHEFAWGISSVNELMGSSHNPWHPERISGGSSGGSAVALAARFVPLALGSDTGGSTRVPSAFCGTVGFKPTFGRINTGGVWPLAPSLDHVGAMARDPADAALLFEAIEDPLHRGADAGASHRSPASLRTADVSTSLGSVDGFAGLTAGVCPDLQLVPLAPAIQQSFETAVRTVSDIAGESVEVAFPDAASIHPTFVTIQSAEALQSHTRAGLFPRRRREYGRDVRGRLEAAEQVTLPDYLDAIAARERLRATAEALFERVDVLLTPVSACSPIPIGDERTMHFGTEHELRELVMPYTVPQDLLGLPACTVRAGFDELGIPIGVQFTARRGNDRAALTAAAALFAATPSLQERWPGDRGNIGAADGAGRRVEP
jgi:aspartyl-tRNA(Asn)/glutamyl-tRNA(Gln) amidotransferase subunit A